MPQIKLLSASEQVAEHLIKEIHSGAFIDEMPGAMRLAKTYGVNHKTMESALQLLEKKQILENNGTRKCRTIRNEKLDDADSKCLRIGFLPMEQKDENVNYIIELNNLLEENGHKLTVIGLGQYAAIAVVMTWIWRLGKSVGDDSDLLLSPWCRGA